MDRPRFLKTEAIVLKHFPLGEADRVLTLYTPVAGKVRAVARGARRVTSRLGGHLEPLTRTQVVITRGKSLDVVSQAETIESHRTLREDLWRGTCGLYLAELVDRFTSEELENARLYRLAVEALAHLDRGRDADLALRYFELRMLMLVGYHPELHRCVACAGGIAPSAQFFFGARSGGVLCPACKASDALARPLSLNTLKVLRLFAGSDLPTASSVRLPPEVAIELEHLLRQYITTILEKELKSTEFLDLLRRDRQSGRPLAKTPL